MKEAREKLDIPLETVEQETKIRKKYIIALEEESFDVIPGKVYVRGFLRNYARFLGLDGEYLVEQYNNYYPDHNLGHFPVAGDEHKNNEKSRHGSLSGALFQGKKYKRLVLIVTIGILLCAGIIFSFSNLTGGNDYAGDKFSQSDKQPPASQSGDAKRNSSPGEHNDVHNKGNSDQTEGVNLVLTFNGWCWLQVQVDKKQAYEGFASSGDKKEFTGQNNIDIHVGDAGVVQATVNGADKGFLGKKGDVVRKTFSVEGDLIERNSPEKDSTGGNSIGRDLSGRERNT